MAFKQLPKTNFLTYISGLHSLNLDLKDGTGCDWHFGNYWRDGVIPVKLYGKGQEVNTNHILGYYGIADRSDVLIDHGMFYAEKVYVANHHRAIVDLVYEYLTKYNQIGYAKGCVEDYFFNEDDVAQLFRQLVKLYNYLDEDRSDLLDGWLSKEFKTQYRSWKSGRLQEGTDLSYKLYNDGGESYYSW